MSIEFNPLEVLSPYSDKVFNQFYDSLLSSRTFAKFFRSSEQVQNLLIKQKDHFLCSLNESDEDIFARFYRVGVIHYQHHIPYEVFLNGAEILRDAFEQVITEEHLSSTLVILCNDFFHFIAEAMAKGYLDEFIKQDKKDANKMLFLIDKSSFGTEKKLLNRHFKWLIELFEAIEQEDIHTMTDLRRRHESDEPSMYHYIKTHLRGLENIYTDAEIDQIQNTALINIDSIIFYLERKAYSDALSLIINILQIYKLTMILDNVITNIMVQKSGNSGGPTASL